MSDTLDVRYTDILNVEQTYKRNLDELKNNIVFLRNSINAVVNDSNFKGAAADSIKNYFSDVHLTILDALDSVAQNMLDNMALYKSGYYSVDASTNFIINEEYINLYKDNLNKRFTEETTGVYDCKDKVDKALLDIADIYSATSPSIANLEAANITVTNEMTNLITNTGTLENQTVDALTNSTAILLEHIMASINAASTGVTASTYQPGAFFNNKNVQAMKAVGNFFDEQHEKYSEEYEAIWNTEKQLEEAAAEREEEGVWKTIGGLALITGGTLCIVFTAGAATPAVVAAGGVVGGGTAIFGLSDTAEGVQDIMYGNAGDIDSHALNVMRDEVFQGNYQAYYITENIFAFTASALIPIGAASKAGTLTLRSGAVATGKVAISTLAGDGASRLTMNATDNRTLSMLAGMSVSTMTGYGLNQLDAKFNISTGTPKTTAQLLQESNCSQEELSKFLSRKVDEGVVSQEAVDLFNNEGIWPDDIQIPKDPAFINPDGSECWDKAPNYGYTLDKDGNPIKESFVPNEGDKFDRYGPSDGRYTSPLDGNQSYSYDERSLPYVEDSRQYHRYQVTGDFNNLEEYVNNCTDPIVRENVEVLRDQYMGGDYSNFSSSRGTAAPVDKWGCGGATQQEFGLNIQILMDLGMVEEIPVPPNRINTTGQGNPYFYIEDIQEEK